MKSSEPKYVKFMGVRIDNVKYEEVFKKIEENRKAKAYICLNDVGNVVGAITDKDLLAAIDQSMLSIADGMPLTWYAKLVGCKRIERISGTDIFKRILEKQNGFKHYLLGDTEDTIERVIRKASRRRRNLQIKGYSPPFKNEFTDDDNREMLDRINREGSDIVWVSFGGGKQEKWMHRNIHRLDKGIMISVGAAFRYYIGDQIMPPKIFQALGLQWVFRAIQNPRKWLRKQSHRFLKFMFYFPWEVIRMRSKLKEKPGSED